MSVCSPLFTGSFCALYLIACSTAKYSLSSPPNSTSLTAVFRLVPIFHLPAPLPWSFIVGGGLGAGRVAPLFSSHPLGLSMLFTQSSTLLAQTLFLRCALSWGAPSSCPTFHCPVSLLLTPLASSQKSHSSGCLLRPLETAFSVSYHHTCVSRLITLNCFSSWSTCLSTLLDC